MSDPSNPEAARQLLQQIDDIKGLHPISLWPLAYGWWAIFFLIGSIGVAVVIFLWRQKKWTQSWKGEAAARLSELASNLDPSKAQYVLAALSEIMRRIALRKYSRIECAGLQGMPWLMWLERHDPSGFKWTVNGKILIHAPYAPPGKKIDPALVSQLVAAGQKWVR